jgi:competence protein ComEC
LLRRQHLQRTRSALLGGCTAVGAAALALPWAATPERFELHVLDVGHGTCAVFRAPGEPCWIFDCGSRDRSRVAQDALAPLLRSWEIDRPKVVLSHVDSDHSGGLRWVLERVPPTQWAGAVPAPWVERLPHTCRVLDIDQGALLLPEAAPGLTIALLRGGPLSGNEGSRSLLLRVGEASILLCGDAVETGWSLPLRDGLLKGHGGLLLAPHHGSEGARIGALLDAFAPAEVWVSNSSRPGIAAELDRRGIAWRCTQDLGPIRWMSQ